MPLVWVSTAEASRRDSVGRASRVHSRGGDVSEVESIDLRHGPVIDKRPLVGSLGHEKPRASVDGPLSETGGLRDGVSG